MPEFDGRDMHILQERMLARHLCGEGPQVGDVVIMPDGTQQRFSHDWGDDIQTTDGKFGASFYLGDGFTSFSGGLNPAIKKEHLIKTDKLEEVKFWYFHHDHPQAHNGVDASVLVPVFEYRPPQQHTQEVENTKTEAGETMTERESRQDQQLSDSYAIAQRRIEALESWITQAITKPSMSREQRLEGLEIVEATNPSQSVRLAVERICPTQSRSQGRELQIER